MSQLRAAPPHAQPPGSALTVVTPLRPWGKAAVGLAFWVGDRFPRLLKPLRTLSLIHFARWSVIPAEPGFSNADLLLFESDFDGDWDEYIDDFAEVVGPQIKAIWGSSYGFPGPVPTAAFRAFVRRHQVIPSVTYAAYPASVTQIAAALTLAEAFASLKAGAAAMDPLTFERRWNEFLTEVQFEL